MCMYVSLDIWLGEDKEVGGFEILCGKVVCSDGVPANNLKHSCSLWNFYYVIDVEVLLVLEDFYFQFVRRHFSKRVLNLTN